MDVHDPPAPPPAAAPEVALTPELTVAEALHAIVQAGLGQMRANEPAAAAAEVEGVHQLRVAVRRLRSGLVLFAPHLEPHALSRFQDELRRLGRVFGAARDWDVFCTETLAQADADYEAEVETLLSAANPRRSAAHRELAAALSGAAYARLRDGLEDFVARARESPAGFGDGRLERTLERLAPRLLARLARKVERRGRHLAQRSPEELHSLRKSLKKLRYGAEFTAGLYPEKRVRGFRHGCKALQKALGRINDSSAALQLAGCLDAGRRADLAPASGALMRWAERRRADAIAGLPHAWRRFRHAPFPWD